MSSDIAISVKNLTKTYRIFNHPGDRIKQALTFGRVKFHREFTALKDVSFDIKKGETVGIIGRNGSGKSTLLQLICGILKPTSGSVTVNGRVSALLELGSGFNPEFTGRENIFFQGAIMGFSKEEMDAKVEEIIAFADIGEFIDQPVRTYSSGMFVRLAFATAIHSEPDILVIDEALAVGDMEFQKKSFAYMANLLLKKLATVILVSHELRQIQRFCSKAVYLDRGVCQKTGNSYNVTQAYYEATLNRAHTLPHDLVDSTGTSRSTDEIELLSVQICDVQGEEISAIKSGEPVNIRILFNLHVYVEGPELIIGTQASDLTFLSSSSTMEYAHIQVLAPGEHAAECIVSSFPLAPGRYFVRFDLRDKDFRLIYTGQTLGSFEVLPEDNGAIKPKRLLNLQSNWFLDGIRIETKQ